MPLRKSDPRFAINSPWTAVVAKAGWNHFRIVDRRWQDRLLQVELMAVCDRSVRFWLDAEGLLDTNEFLLGWK